MPDQKKSCRGLIFDFFGVFYASVVPNNNCLKETRKSKEWVKAYDP